MKITRKVALEVASHEALIRQAYKDSVGVWTWSVGLTSASGHNVERYIGKPQTIDKCLDVFIWALKRYADDVEKAFEGHKLSEAQFAAALSFHWNTGAIGSASWVRHFKAENIPAAKKAFMNWVKPVEITNRRKKERDLFFKGVWSNTGKMGEYTRVRPSGTPDWGSRINIDVSRQIDSLINGTSPKQLPTPQAPDAPPKADKPPSKGGWGALITTILKAFGKGRT